MKVGDKLRCKGIGYPHWKDKVIEVTAVFEDNTIGFKQGDCSIRVDSGDFEPINSQENESIGSATERYN